MLSILDASLDTVVRLYTGLALGVLVAGVCGLAVSWSNWSRRLVALPLHLIRTLPLLAMVPLFPLRFGTYFVGKVIFIAYGVGVIFFVGVGRDPGRRVSRGTVRAWLYHRVFGAVRLPRSHVSRGAGDRGLRLRQLRGVQ